jgi:hypothetical protein
MEDVQVKEDILAVAEELSQDLSTIAAATTDAVEEKPADEKPVEEKIEQPAEEQKQEEISGDDSEKAEEQAEEAVDSEKAEESAEASEEKADAQNPEKEEIKSDDLTAQENKGSEQGDDESQNLIKSLQEENARLKAALHKTLAERVVDTKIALGLESAGDRDKLVEDHATRTASSLADSLRDLAKLPEKKTKAFEVPTMESELAVAEEQNVVTVDEKQEEKEVKGEETFEQLFVDALMGRRKL